MGGCRVGRGESQAVRWSGLELGLPALQAMRLAPPGEA